MIAESKNALRDQSGYTLIETLVAMVLFVSVLLPLGFGTAALLFDRKAEEGRIALILAESSFVDGKLQSSEEIVNRRFIVRKDIALNGSLIEIQVTVSTIREPQKPVLTMCRIVPGKL